jgi:hypothetical protein
MLMPKEVLLTSIALTMLAIILLVPFMLELRTRRRISRDLDNLGGAVLDVRRVTESDDLIEAPKGSLYEVKYLNRWGRQGCRRCRASWFGEVRWLRWKSK